MHTFSRRELQGACGWSFTQVRIHLERLMEQEYVAVRTAAWEAQFVYELLIDWTPGSRDAHRLDRCRTTRSPRLQNEPRGFGGGGDG